MCQRLTACVHPHNSKLSPILVRFIRHIVRDGILRAKSMLKDFNSTFPPADRIYINEDLVDNDYKLTGAALAEFRSKTIQGAWSSYCRIIVKSTSDSIIIQ